MPKLLLFAKYYLLSFLDNNTITVVVTQQKIDLVGH